MPQQRSADTVSPLEAHDNVETNYQTPSAVPDHGELTAAIQDFHLQQKLAADPLSITELPYQKRKQFFHQLDVDAKEQLAKWVEFKTLASSEITPEATKEIAGFAREIFSNTWPEFAFCPECDQNPETPNGKRVSAQKVFGLEPGQMATTEQMDDPRNLPVCDTEDCGQTMKQFFDREKTEEVFAKKMALQDAWVTTMRGADGTIKGVNFVYKDTVKGVFDGEFGDPYLYADVATNPELMRNFEDFREKVSMGIMESDPDYGLEQGALINPDDGLVGANCIAVHPDYQGQGHFGNLMAQTFFAIPYEAYADGYGTFESLPRTRAHQKCLQAGGIAVEGVLSPDGVEITEDDYVIMLYKPLELFKVYCGIH